MKTGAIIAIAFVLAGSADASDGDTVPRVSTALLSELNLWLDTETEYARRDDQPHIVFVGQDQAERLRGAEGRTDGLTRGLYDAAIETIYLTEPWSAEIPRDVSVLLHEMAHHRQAAQHWYCEQAQEWRAYQIQAQWLADQQIVNNFYWPAILLQSSCAKRDIHP